MWKGNIRSVLDSVYYMLSRPILCFRQTLFKIIMDSHVLPNRRLLHVDLLRLPRDITMDAGVVFWCRMFVDAGCRTRVNRICIRIRKLITLFWNVHDASNIYQIRIHTCLLFVDAGCLLMQDAGWEWTNPTTRVNQSSNINKGGKCNNNKKDE